MMSQEEKDRLTKEKIKKERRDQALAASKARHADGIEDRVQRQNSSHTSPSSKNIKYMNSESTISQDQHDKLIKEQIKEERKRQMIFASSVKTSITPGIQQVSSSQYKSNHGYTKTGRDESARSHEDKNILAKRGTKEEQKNQWMGISLRQSTLGGFYDDMIEKEIVSDRITTTTLPKPETGSYESKSIGEKEGEKSRKSKPGSDYHMKTVEEDIRVGLASYKIQDVVDTVENDDGIPQKSAHRSCHKKLIHRSISEGYTEPDSSKVEKKTRDPGRRRTVDDDNPSKSKHNRKSNRRHKSERSHQNTDDELSRKIEAKLRERKLKKKSRKRHGQSELTASLSTNVQGSLDDEPQQDCREFFVNLL